MSAAAAPLLCGVDAGTSQIRAIAFTPDGAQVAAAAEPTPTRVLGPDRAEHDAEELWRATVAVLRRVVAELPDPKAIRGVAVASMGEAGVLLGDGGDPLGPIIAWYDTRTTGELDWLMGAVGFERLHQVTGLCADPTFSLPKLLWHRRETPEQFARARWWLNVGDYLAWRLCGERATDFSLASRTLLLDLERRAWAEPLLEAAGLPASLLPPLHPSGTRIGTLRPEVAAATGLAADCAVGTGGHDHICGLIAVGADAPGVLMDSLGTAEALTMVRDRPLADSAVGWDGFNQGAFGTGTAALLRLRRPADRGRRRRVVPRGPRRGRPRDADRRGRGRRARRRERPLLAAPAAGLAALPRPGRARGVPRHLLGHRPRHAVPRRA